MKNYIVLLLILFGLTGCASNIFKEKVVTRSTVELIKIPDELLKECGITPPPNKELYTSISDPKARENIMVNYAAELVKDLKKCNSQLEQAVFFQNKMEEYIDKINKKNQYTTE